jgi:hypothetical protein
MDQAEAEATIIEAQTMKNNNESQRIYVGGLDPSRGLTVELVASRLHSVKDVEIIAINDVAIKDRGDATTSCPPSEPIYNPKHRVIDEDGDLVDTRKFFYIEARSTSATSSSALDLLAKQYHNTKWKGCSLRVEEAKPHFLRRLEQEREEREAKAAAAAALSAEMKEAQAKEKECNIDEEGAKEVKNRRRLRIRQRFGAEAYLVDTHPRQLQLDNGSSEGWNEFASLRKRMIDKRESQRKNLVERRKQERRSWAGGKGNKESAPSESNDLRSLIFLNRGIHVRFDSIEATDLVSDDNSNVSKDVTEDITEDDESSSSSDSEESSVKEDGDKQKAYMWSDDEDEEDSIADVHDEKDLSSESEEEEVVDEKADTDDESNEKRSAKRTKTNNLKAGAEYTKAVVADEFAFGADFDFDPSNDDIESVHSDNLNAFNESMDIGLEDDISSNINILSKLFPEVHFDSKPLADANDGGNGKNNGSEDAKEKQKFGAGLIMQRYDPTKDADKRFEKVETKVTQPKDAIEEDEQVEDQKEELSPAEDASVSSESSESLSAKEEEEEEEEEEKTTAMITETPLSANAMIEESKEDVYEQDKLENVFKQSRQEASTNAGGFSFGFQVPSEVTKPASDQANQSAASFAFGFNVSEEPKVDKNSTTGGLPAISNEVEDAVEEKRAPATERVRRVGLIIPESVLDDYEDLFFSLNEGPQILKHLDAMKQDEDNQNLWQKEREQLTADWKRKQKTAQSRKVKQKRR